MDPTVPTGWPAFSAWRALSPVQRRGAWSAADQGRAPDDGWVAAVMAGYGATVDRLLRGFNWLLLGVYLVALLGAATLRVYFGLDPELFLGLTMAVYLAIGQAARWVRGRFRRLASAGAVGMQAVHAGAVPLAVPVPAMQSEFTVPYGVPAHHPDLAEAPPPAGPREFMAAANRRRILAIMGCHVLLLAVGVWYLVTVIDSRDYSTSGLGFALQLGTGVAILGGCAFLLVSQVVHNGLKLLHSTVVRGDVNGWALPAAGFSGSWSALHAIDVRAVEVTLTRRGRSGTQVLVFRVADPEAYLAQVGPVRRLLARRAMRRYGSPLTVVMDGRATRPLLAAIEAFADVPVRWT